MFLVMGITGKVGGATARHLLAQGEQVRTLVRDRKKAMKWADQGVELVGGDWNDGAAIARALEGAEGAYVMLPPGWTPSGDFKEFKDVLAAYKEAFAKAPPPRLVGLSAMGAEKYYELFNDQNGPWLAMFQEAEFGSNVDSAIKNGQQRFTTILNSK